MSRNGLSGFMFLLTYFHLIKWHWYKIETKDEYRYFTQIFYHFIWCFLNCIMKLKLQNNGFNFIEHDLLAVSHMT